jgi:hypothetical protein
MEKETRNEKSKSVERFVYDSKIDRTFQEHFKKWHEETINMSSNHDMSENLHYKAIIAMGWEVVPYIIEQLRKKPCHLFDALSAITGELPIKLEHSGRVHEMAADWIKWYDVKYRR